MLLKFVVYSVSVSPIDLLVVAFGNAACIRKLGVVVPIPMLPEVSMRIASTSFAPKISGVDERA